MVGNQRNQFMAEHLRISINGPAPEAYPYRQALEKFFSKPRKIKYSSKQ